MKTGHGSAGCLRASRGEVEHLLLVTVSGGSSTRPSSSGAIHPPAATAITGAAKAPLSVCATAPSPPGAAFSRVTWPAEPDVGAAGPRPAGAWRSSRGPGRARRQSAWNITWLALAKSNAASARPPLLPRAARPGMPQLVSTSCSWRGSRTAPKSMPPVSVSRLLAARRPRAAATAPPRAGQPHVQRVRVGAAEDPGAAVRAAVAVPRAEGLEDHDVQAARRRRPGGAEPARPGADDDQVRACRHAGGSFRPVSRGDAAPPVIVDR